MKTATTIIAAAALPITIFGAAIGMATPASAAIAPSADQHNARPAAERQTAGERKVAQAYSRTVFFENCWWQAYPVVQQQGKRLVTVTHYRKISCPDLNNIRAGDIRRPGPFAKTKRRR